MAENLKTRDALRGEIQSVDAAALLPHQRRDALFILSAETDILDVAEAIANDDTRVVTALLREEKLYKPTLAQLADWCLDAEFRLQFVILQPYVLAQPILKIGN